MSEKKTPWRKPDYNLVVHRKEKSSPSVTIGVAWTRTSKRGSYLSVNLNDGIVLDWRMGDTHHIRLYPVEHGL